MKMLELNIRLSKFRMDDRNLFFSFLSKCGLLFLLLERVGDVLPQHGGIQTGLKASIAQHNTTASIDYSTITVFRRISFYIKHLHENAMITYFCLCEIPPWLLLLCTWLLATA